MVNADSCVDRLRWPNDPIAIPHPQRQRTSVSPLRSPHSPPCSPPSPPSSPIPDPFAWAGTAAAESIAANVGGVTAAYLPRRSRKRRRSTSDSEAAAGGVFSLGSAVLVFCHCVNNFLPTGIVRRNSRERCEAAQKEVLRPLGAASPDRIRPPGFVESYFNALRCCDRPI